MRAGRRTPREYPTSGALRVVCPGKMRCLVLAGWLIGSVLAAAGCSHDTPPPMVPDPVVPIGATDGDAGDTPPDASPDAPLIPLPR
jgi:hypothetical protein